MIIKTKKYKLDPKLYRSMAMKNVMIDLWWVFLIPVAVSMISIFTGSIWWSIGAVVMLSLIHI